MASPSRWNIRCGSSLRTLKRHADTPEELAVKTAPTSLCTPVGAVLTAKLLVQTTTGQRLYYRDGLGRLRHRRAVEIATTGNALPVSAALTASRWRLTDPLAPLFYRSPPGDGCRSVAKPAGSRHATVRCRWGYAWSRTPRPRWDGYRRYRRRSVSWRPPSRPRPCPA